jgi:hypothetical protein
MFVQYADVGVQPEYCMAQQQRRLQKIMHNHDGPTFCVPEICHV